MDKQYKDLLNLIINTGTDKMDRTGFGTRSIFGHQMRFKMSEGFPLLTLRKIHIKSIIHELLWFLGAYDDKYKKFGNTNIKYLLDNGVTFWTEWPYQEYRRKIIKKYQENDLKDKFTIKEFKLLNIKDYEKKIIKDEDFALSYGDLGPVYGKQWLDFGGYNQEIEQKTEYKHTRGGTKLVEHIGWQNVHFPGFNQIDAAIDELENNPDSRRIIVSAWNPNDLDSMLLPPCHMMFQFYTKEIPHEVRLSLLSEKMDFSMKRNAEWHKILMEDNNIPERYLSMQMYQRSCDLGLGFPYNVTEYSLLLHMISQVVNMIPDEFIWTGGDVHLYKNQLDAAKEMINRESQTAPILELNMDIKNIYDFRYNDIKITNYNPHPNIKMDVAV
jgi:thymidylate synthase